MYEYTLAYINWQHCYVRTWARYENDYQNLGAVPL